MRHVFVTSLKLGKIKVYFCHKKAKNLDWRKILSIAWYFFLNFSSLSNTSGFASIEKMLVTEKEKRGKKNRTY